MKGCWQENNQESFISCESCALSSLHEDCKECLKEFGYVEVDKKVNC